MLHVVSPPGLQMQTLLDDSRACPHCGRGLEPPTFLRVPDAAQRLTELGLEMTAHALYEASLRGTMPRECFTRIGSAKWVNWTALLQWLRSGGTQAEQPDARDARRRAPRGRSSGAPR